MRTNHRRPLSATAQETITRTIVRVLKAGKHPWEILYRSSNTCTRCRANPQSSRISNAAGPGWDIMLCHQCTAYIAKATGLTPSPSSDFPAKGAGFLRPPSQRSGR